MYYSVEGLEGDIVVLVGDDNKIVNIKASAFDFKIEPRDVLDIRFGQDGSIIAAINDKGERDKRLKEAKELLLKLRRKKNNL